MTTEIAKPEENKQLADFAQAFAGPGDMTAQDVLIPKLLLMQSLSDAVVDGDAKPGDIIDSVSKEVVATGKEGKVELIPIHIFKNVVIEKFNGSKWEYERTQAYQPGDEKKLWDFVEDGQKMRGNVTYNVYALRADQALEPGTLPVVLSFRRTSKRAGQFFATHFMKCSMAKLPPMAKTVIVASKAEKGEQGPYQIFTASDGRKTSMEEVKAAFAWYDTVKSGLARVDESGEKTSDAPAAGGASDIPF